MIEFYASDMQIKIMCANAVNASFGNKKTSRIVYAKPNDFVLYDAIEIISMNGREVNIAFIKIDPAWCVSFCGLQEPMIKYQTWLRKYKTFKELALTVGIKIE